MSKQIRFGKRKRVYLDSNVFISLINKEIGREFRGLFVEAELFIERIKEQRHILVLSEWFFKEIEQTTHIRKEEILKYFKNLNIKTEVVKEEEKLPIKKFEKRGIPFPDALHLAIAVKQKCDCVVTFNVKDFEMGKNKMEIIEPLEFI